jgi:pyruvate/2-oxoglutarate/acetoin dehydrogenase E1 component
MDSLINQATKYWYLSNEKGTAPIVIRSAVRRRRAVRARSTRRCPFRGLLGVPGLKIVLPVRRRATPRGC